MDQHDVIRQGVDVAVRVIAHARRDCWSTAVAIGATYPVDGDPWLGHAVEQFCDQAQHAPDIGDPTQVDVPLFDGRIDREGLDAITARVVELRALIPPAAVAMVVSSESSESFWHDDRDSFANGVRYGTASTTTRAGTDAFAASPRTRRRTTGAGVIIGVVAASLLGVGAITAAWRSATDDTPASPTASTLSLADVTTPDSAARSASTQSSSAPTVATTSTTSTTVPPTTIATTAPPTTVDVPATVAPTAPARVTPTPVVTAAPKVTTPPNTAPVTTAPPTPTTPTTPTTTPTPIPAAPDLSQLPYYWALATFTPAGAEAMTSLAVDRSPAWAYGQHLRLGFEADPAVARARTSLRQRADGSLEWCITSTCRVLRDIVVTSDGKVESFTVDGSPLARDLRSWAGDGPLLCLNGTGTCAEPAAVAVRLGSVFSVGTSTFVALELTVGRSVSGGVRLGGIQAVVDGSPRTTRAIVAREAQPGGRGVWLVRFDRFDALAPLQLDLDVSVAGIPARWQLADR
jgi:hypothetical protein